MRSCGVRCVYFRNKYLANGMNPSILIAARAYIAGETNVFRIVRQSKRTDLNTSMVACGTVNSTV